MQYHRTFKFTTLIYAVLFSLVLAIQMGCSNSDDAKDPPPTSDTPNDGVPGNDGGETPAPMITSENAVEISQDLVTTQTSVALVFMPIQSAFITALNSFPAGTQIRPLAAVEFNCADIGGEGIIAVDYNYDSTAPTLSGTASTTGCTVDGASIVGSITYNVGCSAVTSMCESDFGGNISIAYENNEVQISNLVLHTTSQDMAPFAYSQSVAFDLSFGEQSVHVESGPDLMGYLDAANPFPYSGTITASANDGSAMRFTATEPGYTIELRETADGTFVSDGVELYPWPTLSN